jgi:HEPN domain-containing protein
VSHEYAETLMRRASEYLLSAERNYDEGLYDIACVEAEIAAQLAIKAAIVKAGLSAPRVHSIRRLIAFIVENTEKEDIKKELLDYVRMNRAKLIVLERCREAGQYGMESTDREEAEIALEASREVIRLAKEIWELGF